MRVVSKDRLTVTLFFEFCQLDEKVMAFEMYERREKREERREKTEEGIK